MEIEKGLNKQATSGAGDSGASSRAFATLLTWMSDHTSPAFVIATSNDHTKLPLEFTRKGRFDELFWLDLPKVQERKEIFRVILKKYGRDASKLNLNLSKLADTAEGFTGAEIEQAVISALYSCFNKGGGKTELTQVALIDELVKAIPLSVTNKKELEEMREKAVGKLKVAGGSGKSEMFTLPGSPKAPTGKVDVSID